MIQCRPRCAVGDHRAERGCLHLVIGLVKAEGQNFHAKTLLVIKNTRLKKRPPTLRAPVVASTEKTPMQRRADDVPVIELLDSCTAIPTMRAGLSGTTSWHHRLLLAASRLPKMPRGPRDGISSLLSVPGFSGQTRRSRRHRVPTRSRGMSRSSPPCLRNITPADC